MTIDGDDDLEGLRRVGRAVAEARDAMLAAVAPGVATSELDAVGRDVLRAHGARSAPQLAVGFPAATCISVNDEAAHGIPSPWRRLRDGDLVNVDVSAELDGYWADTGASAPVGRVSPVARRLLDATRLAQRDAMAAARAGRPLRHIGRAVQRRARRHGLRVIANLCGHGVGGVPPRAAAACPASRTPATTRCCGRAWCSPSSRSCRPGATHAVEGGDGWTLRTADGSLAAQFEHTVVVTHGRPLVLTA